MTSSAKKISSLSKAAESFRQRIGAEPLCAKAEALQSASRALACLAATDSLSTEEAALAVHGIRDAFQALVASYDPPSASEDWRDFVAWNNLIALYGALDL